MKRILAASTFGSWAFGASEPGAIILLSTFLATVAGGIAVSEFM